MMGEQEYQDGVRVTVQSVPDIPFTADFQGKEYISMERKKQGDIPRQPRLKTNQL